MVPRLVSRVFSACVAMVALAFAGLAPASAQTALVEDFDTLGPHWYPAVGDWEVGDGVVHSLSGGGPHGSRLSLLGYRLREVATADVTLQTTGGGSSTWAGVTVHRDGLDDSYTESGYTVLLRNSGELAVISANSSGGVDYLASAPTAARPGQGWETISVELSAGALSATAGGVTIHASDGVWSGGGFTLAHHRDLLMSVESVHLDGLDEVDETVPQPSDCIAWDGQPVPGERGEVLNSPARIEAVRDRVAAGVEPQIEGAERLLAETVADLVREPSAPRTYFVPFFYNHPEAHRSARDALQNDANAAYRLALAYRLTGEVDHADHAVSVINDWMETVECVRTSEDSALAFSYHFPAFIYAAELLRGTSVWPTADEERFAGFLDSVALPVAESIMHRSNNWGSWALALKTSIAAYLDDVELLNEAQQRATELIDYQLDVDAHLHEEVDRNNGVGDYGIWYTHFSLFPNLIAAEVLTTRGVDLHTYVNQHGVTTGDAGAEVAGWVEQPETFPYFTGDVGDLANVRTIDYLRADGIIAHSMSYFVLLGNHYEIDAVDRLLDEEGAMTTIHALPHLSLTHGALSAVAIAGPGDDEPGGDQPGGDEPGGDEPGGDEPGGDEPGGDEPGGDEPGGDEPGGDEPGGDQPGGDEPGGDQPGGDQPGAVRPGAAPVGALDSGLPVTGVTSRAAPVAIMLIALGAVLFLAAGELRRRHRSVV